MGSFCSNDQEKPTDKRKKSANTPPHQAPPPIEKVGLSACVESQSPVGEEKKLSQSEASTPSLHTAPCHHRPSKVSTVIAPSDSRRTSWSDNALPNRILSATLPTIADPKAEPAVTLLGLLQSGDRF